MLTVPDFPSALVSDDPRGHVSYEQLKADRIVVEKAAANLRWTGQIRRAYRQRLDAPRAVTQLRRRGRRFSVTGRQSETSGNSLAGVGVRHDLRRASAPPFDPAALAGGHYTSGPLARCSCSGPRCSGRQRRLGEGLGNRSDALARLSLRLHHDLGQYLRDGAANNRFTYAPGLAVDGRWWGAGQAVPGAGTIGKSARSGGRSPWRWTIRHSPSSRRKTWVVRSVYVARSPPRVSTVLCSNATV
jgi:hypothetical protein